MKDPSLATRPLKVFFSYSREDESYLNELRKHLAILERQGLIEPWHDRHIQPGDSWQEEIDESLSEADLVLLLISANFIHSKNCNIELDRATQRQAAGATRIIPIIVSECLTDGWALKEIQWLPRDAKPVDTWSRRNDAWTNVAEGIKTVIKELQANAKADSVTSPTLEKPQSVTRKRKRTQKVESKPRKQPVNARSKTQKDAEEKRDYSEAVLEVLRSLPATRGLYVHPYIPDQRQLEARQACEIPSIENMLGLIYYTVFLVAKRYIAFCDSGIYMNMDPSPPVIRYSDFARREFGKSDQFLELGLNEKAIMADDLYGRDYMLRLLLQIKDAIK